MAATDGQIVIAAARWCEEGHYLREFITKHQLPAVVKIIKGQYSGLGVPSLPNPGLQSTALLVTAGMTRKLVAQAVKLKEGRRLIPVGPRLAIPETYSGYFELLSEEGRAVRCIESVAELARRRPEHGCLVREPVRAVMVKPESIDSTLPIAEGARTIAPGEILVPCGESGLTGSRGKYLRCVDSHGDNLLLPIEQRAKFSALAREDNISGVHTAKNLLCKRLPLTVRLVHGSAPRGLKTPSQFLPELRLLAACEEEHIFALPLQKESIGLVALPLAAPLKLLRTRNEEQLKNLPEFRRLVDRTTKLLTDVRDRVHVLEGRLAAVPRSGYWLRRSASSDSAVHKQYSSSSSSASSRRRDENKAPPVISRLAPEYDEIDQIYDYVRGFAPLPKSVLEPVVTCHISSTPSSPKLDMRPEPPPIETIPTKKQSASIKRTRRTVETTNIIEHKEKVVGLPKLYIKNGSAQKTRLLRQKSASPMKEGPPSPASKLGSPLFNIRYKSLTNLQQAMELDALHAGIINGGTLDSSHSGGRTSGDSAGAKLPEKRSRKLSRPRSLTNLVWGKPPTEHHHHPQPPPKSKPEVTPIHRKSSNKLTIGGHRRAGTLYL